MTTKQKHSSDRFTFIGRPPAGTPTAVAVVRDKGVTVFIGTEVGLYRSTGYLDGQIEGWMRLPGAPVGILCLAVSPGYPSDHTLAVGTNTGIFLSRDSGDSWTAGKMTMGESVILSLIFSPDFTRDGILLAGSLEDGVLFSDTRGIHWGNRSFGLLDLTVNSLAISSGFTQDETIFAGTDTAVYYSYNQARAWKELLFPEDAGPILCLAYSSGHSGHPLLYAGTESSGLFFTSDLGKTWQPSSLPAVCINALSASPVGAYLVAATDEGLFLSQDSGAAWEQVLDIPNTICLADHDTLTVVGGVDRGAWLGSHFKEWTPLPDPASRALIGMCLSEQFENDGTGFLYGPEEGIWKTIDSGFSWEQLEVPELGAGAAQLCLSSNFHQDHLLLAAARTGLWSSRDGGKTMRVLVDLPCEKAVLSANGKFLAAYFKGAGIRFSEDLGESWSSLPGPWDTGGKLVGLVVANNGQVVIVHLEGIGQTVRIWQGQYGDFEEVLSFPAGGNEVVCTWLSGESAADRPWFLGHGLKVWKMSGRKGASPVDTGFQPAGSGSQTILSLA